MPQKYSADLDWAAVIFIEAKSRSNPSYRDFTTDVDVASAEINECLVGKLQPIAKTERSQS